MPTAQSKLFALPTHTMLGVLQMYLDLFREGCTEHHCVSDAFMRHGILFDNASYLWFKSHVQHTICLVQDQVADRDTKEEEEPFKE